MSGGDLSQRLKPPVSTAALKVAKEVAALVADRLKEHYPALPVSPWNSMGLIHLAGNPIVGLILLMRKIKGGEGLGMAALDSADFARYIEALRAIANLAPKLHRALGDAITTPVAPPCMQIESDIASAMAGALDHFASAGDFAAAALATCLRVTRTGDRRRHWHFWGRSMGEMVAGQLRNDVQALGWPALASSLKSADSLATRLTVGMLGLGGENVTPEALAALHRNAARKVT